MVRGILMKQGEHFSLYSENGVRLATSNESPYPRLSLKNCQAIERGYDLDELADEVFEKRPKEIPYVDEYDFKQGVMVGFQKALEILGDRKFTEKDLRKGIHKGYLMSRKIIGTTDTVIDIHKHYSEQEDTIVQSLLKKEWTVEIVTEDEKSEVIPSGSSIEESDAIIVKSVTKLDENNCLILKPIV